MGAGAGVKTGIKIGGEILDSGRRFLGETLDYAVDALGNRIGSLGNIGPGKPKLTPTQRQAQDILDLLSEGRANEITDEMMTMPNGTDQANFNMYLADNYDLPMDEASRMAQADEMGLNRDVYHGDEYTGRSEAFNRPNERAYFAYDPHDAGDYASYWTNPNPEKGRLFGEGAQIQNVMVRAQNRAVADDISSAYEEVSGMDRGYLSDESWSPLHPDLSEYSTETADELQRRGFDSVFHADDSTPLNGDYVDTIAILDPPGNVRSKHARMDPRLKHLSHLSAGVGGLGLLPYFQDQYGADYAAKTAKKPKKAKK